MRIGIPKEIKTLEGRVALIPEAAAELVRLGHEVMIEKSAGLLGGYSDDQYAARGIKILPDASTLYGSSELIVKVKEPINSELSFLQKDHLLFCFLHLAANQDLTRQLQNIGLTAIAFETVEEAGGILPVLAPMSDIAGRLATQIGSNLLHQPHGGKGLLLGGLPAAERGKVVVIGAGMAGGNAALVACSLGANVVVFDQKREKLTEMRALGNSVTGLYPYRDLLEREIQDADLLIGAVLIPGEKAPFIVTEEMVMSMKPGGVIIDIAIDQGGCIETTHATDYRNPTYLLHDKVHFAVTNMPGAVPRSASQALSAALLPYLVALTKPNWHSNVSLNAGLNVQAGKIMHPGVKKAFEPG
ncbi:MAG: alanine dehydrogenase [Gammaproteobacteria bacterium]